MKISTQKPEKKPKLFVPDSDTVKNPRYKFCFIALVGPGIVSASVTSNLLKIMSYFINSIANSLFYMNLV